ncbi:tetratricopeptide repeat protein 12 isoform X3 [Nematostella vectensis]|uniref:tetratricopeptide repeat protein 12 isoform X3 n=1 Tax=Nematostella vectensis TaxID=45351 RepID=UPI0020770797|nr:tetratricopeptide repeat protein 12 isoform X3 [Nematostella vectensis]
MDRFKQNMAGKTEGDDDIKSFLSKVDEIESIMKGLTSSEEEKQTVALKKADEYLSVHGDKADASIIHDKETGITTKIGFDGTQINKSCGPKKASDNVGAVSAEDFMKAVSDDAKARASERKQREAVALQLKEKGNLAFKQQKYEEAVKLYTQALNQDRTNTAFYTNRAQAYIRTKNYTDAITDCEAAIKLDKKCIKAYVHMGKAFQAQNKFDEAVDIFKMAIKNLPKQGKLIEDYITEAELGKTRYLQEEKAARLIAERADSATEMESAVKLLLLPDQGIMGYLQAIKQIDTLLATDINRTLFRTCNGFKLSHATNNTPISRIWSGSESLKNIDDIEMMCGIMRVLKKACKDNNFNVFLDFNVKEFLSIDHSHAFCRHLTEPADTLVTEAMTSLLHELSITEVGRSLLVAGEDFVKVMEELLKVAARETIVSEVAMSTVNNIALDDGRINQELRRRLPLKPRIHDRTVARTLDGMLFRVKLARPLLAERNRPDVLQKRVDYGNWFMNRSVVHHSVFVDECGYNIWTARCHGRARQGERAYRQVCGQRGRNITVTMAISPINGLVFHSAIIGGMNAQRFSGFLTQARLNLDPDEMVIFIYYGAQYRAENATTLQPLFEHCGAGNKLS